MGASAGGAPLSKDRAWLVGMCGAVFLALLSFSSYVVALPLIQLEWDLDHTTAAFVFSAYLVGLAVASLLVVPLTDRYPSERFVVLGVGVLVLANLLFPLVSRGLASAVALRFVAGVGHVSAYFPGIRIVSRRFELKGRGFAVASFVASGYLGTTLSYAVTGSFLSRGDTWRAAYFHTAAIGLAALPLVYLLCRKSSTVATVGTGSLLLAPSLHPPVALAIGAYALHSAELYLARLWLPGLLAAYLVGGGEDTSRAMSQAASLSGFMFTTGVVGVLVSGFLSDRWGRTQTAGLFFAASGACSFGLGFLLEAPPFLILGVGFVYGFATAADSPIYATAVTELAPREKLGSALAMQSFTGFLAGAIAPLAGGFVLDRMAGDAAWPTTFGLNGLVAVAGLVLLRALRKHPSATAMALGKG